jgi:hypothetical protein
MLTRLINVVNIVNVVGPLNMLPAGFGGSGDRLGLGARRRRGNGRGLAASRPEALLGALLGEPVASADLIPRGPGFAGGLDLGGLKFVGRFAQAPGGVEPAHRPVGDVESAERGEDPLDGTLGGHHHSVVDSGQRSMIR